MYAFRYPGLMDEEIRAQYFITTLAPTLGALWRLLLCKNPKGLSMAPY